MMLKISRLNCGRTASTRGRELGVNSLNRATRPSISSFVTILEAMRFLLVASRTDCWRRGVMHGDTVPHLAEPDMRPYYRCYHRRPSASVSSFPDTGGASSRGNHVVSNARVAWSRSQP